MIAQSVAEIVSRHVKLTVEGIDRIYLNVYVPRLQYEQGIVGFFRAHRGQPLPSAALMSPMTRDFVMKLEDFAARHGIAVVPFCKGQRKDDVMAEHLRRFKRQEGIVFVGKAQENTPVFRTERRRSPKTGRAYPWIVRRSAMVNNYYIYAVDRDFGPFFLKFCSYFPFNAKLCLNGHEYAKRQLAREGIAFEALDNGILRCADPKRLQAICNRLSAAKIDALLRKWLELLPHPFTAADRKAGYRYDISILQAEFSTTQVLDRPVHGRLFFEQVIRENLDLGRPEEVQFIFNRRIPRNPKARFRTRIVTQQVTPSLNVYYKNTRIKQYHKENRALRTETTINNTYDFGIGRRLHNLPRLREIGFAANRRLIEAERLSHDCILSEDAFQAINGPLAAGRQRVSGLRFADPRVHLLLHALVLFRQLRTRLPRHRPAPASRRFVRMRSSLDLPGRNHLPTAQAAPARLDRARAQKLPLSRYRLWLPRRPVLHTNLQPSPAPRPGRRALQLRPITTPSQARLRSGRRRNRHDHQPNPARPQNLTHLL